MKKGRRRETKKEGRNFNLFHGRKKEKEREEEKKREGSSRFIK